MVFLKDLTIQVDPNATGVLKLPNLLDIMSKIVDDENHDGQIMDAFKWAISNIITYCCLSCFDKNGSGTLTRSDMEHVLAVNMFAIKDQILALISASSFSPQNLGERLYEDEIRGLLDDGDEGDGTIVYSKFFAMENA